MTVPILATRVSGASARTRSIGSSSGGGFRSVTVTAAGGAPPPESARHAVSLPEKYPPFVEPGGPLNRAGTIRVAPVMAAILPGTDARGRGPYRRACQSADN